MLADRLGLDRGCEFLLARQAADGGWHSETYGALRGGAAITALVLDALAHGGDDLLRLARPAAERAVAFLLPGIRRRGCVSCPDGTLDYPVYATSLLLTADSRWTDLLAPAVRGTLRQYLVDSQVTRRRGFSGDSPHLGGWDLGGVPPPSAVTTGTNISITAFALEALAATSPAVNGDTQRPAATPAAAAKSAAKETANKSGNHVEAHEARRSRVPSDVLESSLAWLSRCQTLTGDGGFCYSPDPASADNKVPRNPDDSSARAASYGTATCDGIRALTACGVQPSDEPLRRALDWLANHRTEPGIPGLRKSDWSQAMTYYFLSSLARALPAWHDAEIVRQLCERIRRDLTAEQKPDGSWASAVSRMREDDPLIATSLAVVAWARSETLPQNE